MMMLRNPNRILSTVVVVVFCLTACSKKSDEDSEFNVPRAKRFSYAARVRKLHAQQNHEKLTKLFKTIENHQSVLDKSGSPKSDKVTVGEVSNECSDEDVNRLLESFLAREVMLNSALSKKISSIFHKVFAGMDQIHLGSDPKSWFAQASEIWSKNHDFENVLPVTQKQNRTDLLQELHEGHSPALELDFLLYNGKKKDGIGVPPLIQETRDHIYFEVLIPERGKRWDGASGHLRDEYGIVNFEVADLKVPHGRPWLHWGRDACHVAPHSSKYNLKALDLHIPLVCGVSGTSSVAFWSIFASKALLSEEELRLLLLSIWSSLCADGGHSLQEVISAAKLNASYFEKILKEREKYQALLASVSIPTLTHWIQLLRDFSATGASENPGSYGRYFDSFFSRIQEEGFAHARKNAHEALIHYLESPDACVVSH